MINNLNGNNFPANNHHSIPATAQDEQLESNGVKILIDMKSYLYLNGTEIDFRDEVMGKGFVFKNPNATSSCGCGSSFSA